MEKVKVNFVSGIYNLKHAEIAHKLARIINLSGHLEVVKINVLHVNDIVDYDTIEFTVKADLIPNRVIILKSYISDSLNKKGYVSNKKLLIESRDLLRCGFGMILNHVKDFLL